MTYLRNFTTVEGVKECRKAVILRLKDELVFQKKFSEYVEPKVKKYMDDFIKSFSRKVMKYITIRQRYIRVDMKYQITISFQKPYTDKFMEKAEKEVLKVIHNYLHDYILNDFDEIVLFYNHITEVALYFNRFNLKPEFDGINDSRDACIKRIEDIFKNPEIKPDNEILVSVTRNEDFTVQTRKGEKVKSMDNVIKTPYGLTTTLDNIKKDETSLTDWIKSDTDKNKLKKKDFWKKLVKLNGGRVTHQVNGTNRMKNIRELIITYNNIKTGREPKNVIHIQSVSFNTHKYTERNAIKFLKKHDLETDIKVPYKSKITYIQVNPNTEKFKYSSGKYQDGVRFIYGFI